MKAAVNAKFVWPEKKAGEDTAAGGSAGSKAEYGAALPAPKQRVPSAAAAGDAAATPAPKHAAAAELLPQLRPLLLLLRLHWRRLPLR